MSEEKQSPGLVRSSALATLRDPYLIVDDFLPESIAEAMRADIDRHFGTPELHRPSSHQVWNYWFVPGLYAYLRTLPENVIHGELVQDFLGALQNWSIQRLGLGRVMSPYLSMYVAGCGQGLHNDSENGRFAYVYSLTRNDRKTIGGETIVFKEGDTFRRYLSQAQAGHAFFDLIEPRFNRLVVFDDRLPHGVERLSGPMDPAEARYVLHGHLREQGMIVSGALAREDVEPILMSAALNFAAASMARLRLFHGLAAVRMEVATSGSVDSCGLVVDRVTASDGADVGWTAMSRELIERFRQLKFPSATGPTTITQPILLGPAFHS